MSPRNDAVHHRQLHRVVSERLRTAILDGELKPGEWLRQKQIAEEMGVSEMPVREALKTLAAEGVVDYIPYRGARVIEFSRDDVADLYAQRSFLEGRAAKVAARRITPEELSTLHDLQVQMQNGLTQERLSEHSHLNRRFHQVIYTASRRDYLVRALDQMWSTFPTMMMSYFAQRGERSLIEREAQDLEEHAAVIAALESGDGDQAEQLMRQHIETNCEELLAVLSC
jgi:DNA-binding GntR family transcriptional regulator